MAFTVAIVGRPNVGKSTIFNRLVGKRLALVDDTPGFTRDRREGQVNAGGLSFTVIDTAGLEESTADTLEARMLSQTERAIDSADVALLVIDARAGLTPLDEHFARRVRKRRTPVILVANKCEGTIGAAILADCHRLGFGEAIEISAEHGLGIGDLLDALRPHAPSSAIAPSEEDGGEDEDTRLGTGEVLPRRLQLAILGRPNVGKSTLANQLLGEDRLLTGPEPGVTRDAIPLDWEYSGRPIRLVDTAGLRRRAKVTDRLERLSAVDALRAVRFAEVVILVVDGGDPLNRQDLGLASMVAEEGRALVVAVNKADTIADRSKVMREIHERIDISLAQVKGVEIILVSALTGEGVEKLMAAVFRAHELWNRHISTSELNRFMSEVIDAHPPPRAGGRRSKIRYITQAKTRPPCFTLFGNKLSDLPDTYLRYIVNAMRESFDLPGVPIRIALRGGENPYAKKKPT